MIQSFRILIDYLLFYLKHYIPLVENKNFQALIDNKPFFDIPITDKQEAYDYTTKKLLDYFYHQNYHRYIGIDLSRQINTRFLQ